MRDRSKVALCLAGAIFCIGCAGALIRLFSNQIPEQEITSYAGPALSLNQNFFDRNAEPDNSDEANNVQYAHIAGAVQNPGVYRIESNSRVFNLLQLAGGPRSDADLESINLAAPVRDGAQILIKSKSLDSGSPEASQDTKTKRSKGSKNSKNSQNKTASPQIVNVNTANEEELAALPGVGPVLAKRIADYRRTHGSFASAEDLKKVSGIGSKKLEAMRSLLRF